MKSKSLILLFVSLGFGLVAAIGISQVMGRNRVNPDSLIRKVPVLVARTTIDHETVLGTETVAVEQWPANIVPEDALKDLKELENMVVSTRVLKGLPILKSSIINANEVKRLPIPAGKKVVAIPLEQDDTINGLIQPGDRVDIVGVFKEQKGTRQVSTSRTFLKNMQVFSVGDNYRRDVTRETTSVRGRTNVGLLVTEKEAELLVLARDVAKLKLVVRGEGSPEDEPSGIDSPFMDQLRRELAGVGNVDEENSAAEPPKPNNAGQANGIAGLLGLGNSSAPRQSGFQNVIWSGDTRVVTKFDRNGRVIDPNDSRVRSPQPLQLTGTGTSPDPAGSDDSAQSAGETDGMDEDQYPSG